jgi:Aerobic-type carbon monoxide dehydrogenase, middle subunit CoxM/CutM homologs
MITDYHRPKTVEEALKLLSESNARPLGGGTTLTQLTNETFPVVDLQSLGLNKIIKSANVLNIGATVTLQELLESPSTPPVLKTSIKLEGPLNQRNRRTVAGALITSNGRSPFATMMIAMDARLSLNGRETSVHALGDFLISQSEILKKKLVTNIEIPIRVNIAFETVGRSPSDKPILCAALAQWKSGRIRLAIGGWGKIPTLAFDGTEASGIDKAASNAVQESKDEWGSAEYRTAIVGVLVERCLGNLSKGNAV